MTINQGFVPRNIDQRASQLKIIQAKELDKFYDFFKILQLNLKALQDKTSTNTDEQTFINLLKYSHIKLINQLSVSIIKDGNIVFNYNWKENSVSIQSIELYNIFTDNNKMLYNSGNLLIKDYIQKYLHFKPDRVTKSYKFLIKY